MEVVSHHLQSLVYFYPVQPLAIPRASSSRGHTHPHIRSHADNRRGPLYEKDSPPGPVASESTSWP